MQLWEILFIIAVVLFVTLVLGIRICRIIMHKPIDECACCQKSTKKLLNDYHKKYGKSNKSCCCNR